MTETSKDSSSPRKVKLRSPDQVREWLQKRYLSQRWAWLLGTGIWPLVIPLGNPKEEQFQLLRPWISSWQQWLGKGELCWREVRWRMIGTQRIPHRLILHNAEEATAWLQEERRWERVKGRHGFLKSRWPETASADRHYDTLADPSEEDWSRMFSLLEWLKANPSSGFYLRQLPISGLDTKWLERHRRLITDFLGIPDGLKSPPATVRFRLLDPELRARTANLGDLSTPVDHLANLKLPIKRVFVVENLQTGLAFQDLPGCLMIFGLGYGAELLGQIPWLQELPCYYWGDLDTHGFNILNRVRGLIPQIHSLLMDELTLLDHRHLWGEEPSQCRALQLSLLRVEEHSLYQSLKSQRWGANVRLEQERIDWKYAWSKISAAIFEG